jgi:phosphoglycolate phosphatase-like HAD superfamily hydrolase
MVGKIHCHAVIFDFDGTLANSMPFLQKIGVEIMMKHFGVSKEDATKRYVSTTGLPYEHQIKMNFPDDPRNEAAIEEFEQLKIDRIFEQDLFPDTIRVVKGLKEMGLDIFVSSSTFQPTIEEYFERREIKGLFKSILGYRPNFEKGADHFNYIHSEFDVSFYDMLFVGDSLKDYERTQGICSFVGLVGLFSKQDFMIAGHKDPIISNLSELLDLIKAID